LGYKLGEAEVLENIGNLKKDKEALSYWQEAMNIYLAIGNEMAVKRLKAKIKDNKEAKQ